MCLFTILCDYTVLPPEVWYRIREYHQWAIKDLRSFGWRDEHKCDICGNERVETSECGCCAKHACLAGACLYFIRLHYNASRPHPRSGGMLHFDTVKFCRRCRNIPGVVDRIRGAALHFVDPCKQKHIMSDKMHSVKHVVSKRGVRKKRTP